MNCCNNFRVPILRTVVTCARPINIHLVKRNVCKHFNDHNKSKSEIKFRSRAHAARRFLFATLLIRNSEFKLGRRVRANKLYFTHTSGGNSFLHRFVTVFVHSRWKNKFGCVSFARRVHVLAIFKQMSSATPFLRSTSLII